MSGETKGNNIDLQTQAIKDFELGDVQKLLETLKKSKDLKITKELLEKLDKDDNNLSETEKQLLDKYKNTSDMIEFLEGVVKGIKEKKLKEINEKKENLNKKAKEYLKNLNNTKKKIEQKRNKLNDTMIKISKIEEQIKNIEEQINKIKNNKNTKENIEKINKLKEEKNRLKKELGKTSQKIKNNEKQIKHLTQEATTEQKNIDTLNKKAKKIKLKEAKITGKPQITKIEKVKIDYGNQDQNQTVLLDTKTLIDDNKIDPSKTLKKAIEKATNIVNDVNNLGKQVEDAKKLHNEAKNKAKKVEKELTEAEKKLYNELSKTQDKLSINYYNLEDDQFFIKNPEKIKNITDKNKILNLLNTKNFKINFSNKNFDEFNEIINSNLQDDIDIFLAFHKKFPNYEFNSKDIKSIDVKSIKNKEILKNFFISLKPLTLKLLLKREFNINELKKLETIYQDVDYNKSKEKKLGKFIDKVIGSFNVKVTMSPIDFKGTIVKKINELQQIFSFDEIDAFFKGVFEIYKKNPNEDNTQNIIKIIKKFNEKNKNKLYFLPFTMKFFKENIKNFEKNKDLSNNIKVIKEIIGKTKPKDIKKEDFEQKPIMPLKRIGEFLQKDIKTQQKEALKLSIEEIKILYNNDYDKIDKLFSENIEQNPKLLEKFKGKINILYHFSLTIKKIKNYSKISDGKIKTYPLIEKAIEIDPNFYTQHLTIKEQKKFGYVYLDVLEKNNQLDAKHLKNIKIQNIHFAILLYNKLKEKFDNNKLQSLFKTLLYDADFRISLTNIINEKNFSSLTEKEKKQINEIRKQINKIYNELISQYNSAKNELDNYESENKNEKGLTIENIINKLPKLNNKEKEKIKGIFTTNNIEKFIKENTEILSKCNIQNFHNFIKEVLIFREKQQQEKNKNLAKNLETENQKNDFNKIFDEKKELKKEVKAEFNKFLILIKSKNKKISKEKIIEAFLKNKKYNNLDPKIKNSLKENLNTLINQNFGKAILKKTENDIKNGKGNQKINLNKKFFEEVENIEQKEINDEIKIYEEQYGKIDTKEFEEGIKYLNSSLSNNPSNKIQIQENSIYDPDSGTLEIINNNGKREKIKLDPDEKILASQNPETLKNMVNFYETLSKLGLTKLWNIRKQIFKSIENVVGIGFNIDGDYLNKNEIKIFLNSILKSIGEQEISPVFTLENFVAEIQNRNKYQILGGGEKIENFYYSETYLENKFKNKFINRDGNFISFNQSKFEKALTS